MDDTTKDKLAVNAKNAWKMWSNWVITASGAVFAIYLALPLEQQAELVKHLPVPPWAIPIAGSVLGVIARLWPQKSISPDVAAAKSSDAPVVQPSDEAPKDPKS